jgi:hypothetical protein
VHKQSQHGVRRPRARSHRQGRDWPLDETVATAEAAVRRCDHPECPAAGEHRAPRSRDALRSYFWFCLDHVREYNKAWNYYADMSDDQVEAERRKDTFWHRPTWPLGRNGRLDALKDPFGLFEDGPDGAAAEEPARQRFRENAPELAALATMDLKPPVTIATLKARYKILVKQHHPDANGGDKQAEDRLKEINQAYATLMRSFGA